MIGPAELDEILKQEESPTLEFKLQCVLTGPNRDQLRDELAKDLIALANSGILNGRVPAYLIIGAGDTLNPDGTRDAADVRPSGHTREAFLDIANARCNPPIQNLFYREIEVGGNYYGVVEIPPSLLPHELARDLVTARGVIWRRGSVLVRHGDQVAVAGQEEILLMRRGLEPMAPSPPSNLELLEEWLPDPTKRLKVRNLVLGEARRLRSALAATEWLEKDEDERYAAIGERMAEYEALARPLLDLITLGCYSGDEGHDEIWSEALHIVAHPEDTARGSGPLIRLRRYPALLLLYAGGIAAVMAGKYHTLGAMLKGTEVRSYGQNRGVSFGLAPGRIVDPYDERHLALVDGIRLKLPMSHHLARVLREPLDGIAHTAERFQESLVRFDYLFALVSAADENGLLLGSFGWESELMKSANIPPPRRLWIAAVTDQELERLGQEWPPLKAGLFEGPLDQFLAFKRKTDQELAECAARQFFGGG